MKNNNYPLLTFAIAFAMSFTVLAASSQDDVFNLDPIKPAPKLKVSVLKPNLLTIDNHTYTLPDSLKLIKLPNGKFKVDKIDLLGHKVGNGGDYIRSTFIQLGQKVLQYLTTTDAGDAIVRKNNLNTDDLKASLDINSIVLTDDTLFDNGGSVVEAIGIPGLIILNSEAWLAHFENERNVHYLIFHEMLRSSAVNDDNYIVSNDIVQFPTSLKTPTRLLPLIPMIDQDSIQGLFDLSNVSTGGAGCADKKQYYAELDLTKNALEISLNNYVAQNDAKRLTDRKGCNLAIPMKLPKNKRLVISLVDLQGVVSPKTTLKSVATVNFEAFVAGEKNSVKTKTINLGADDRSFLFRKTDLLKSGCGTQDIIRLNTSAVLSSTGSSAEAAATNSVQVKKISILMNLEDCK